MKKRLSSIQFFNTQNYKIEQPNSGKHQKNFKEGTYHCVVCDTHVFSSEHKYKTRTGYATFTHATDEVGIRPGRTAHGKKEYRLERSHIRCINCGANLGVLYFDDKASATGNRYSPNGNSLKFHKAKKVVIS